MEESSPSSDISNHSVAAGTSQRYNLPIKRHPGRPSGSSKKENKIEQPFKHVSTVYEYHRKTIYGCAFSPYLSDPPYFATVGENRVTIYCVPKESTTIKALRHYQDSARDEAFFTVCWAYDPESKLHVVIVGGIRGIIRIIDVKSGKVINDLIGHGDAVNDICVCPNDSLIIASASKDFTARIWSIRNSACLAILGGVQGHLDQVISVSFGLSCNYLASASMDHTIKLWYIGKDSGVHRLIEQSRSILKLVDSPAEIHYPYGSTRDIHTNYVDCVRIFHDVIFSKSTEDEIVLWKFGDFSDHVAGRGTDLRTENAVLHIRQMELPNSNMWFIKFEIDPTEKFLICGNQSGELHIWELKNGSLPSVQSNFIIRAKDVYCTMRQVAFSPCGEHMIAVADDASVSRFSRTPGL